MCVGRRRIGGSGQRQGQQSAAATAAAIGGRVSDSNQRQLRRLMPNRDPRNDHLRVALEAVNNRCGARCKGRAVLSAFIRVICGFSAGGRADRASSIQHRVGGWAPGPHLACFRGGRRAVWTVHRRSFAASLLDSPRRCVRAQTRTCSVVVDLDHGGAGDSICRR